MLGGRRPGDIEISLAALEQTLVSVQTWPLKNLGEEYSPAVHPTRSPNVKQGCFWRE